MMETPQNAGSWGRASGEDPSALKPLTAILEGFSLETEGVGYRELEISAWEAMVAMVKAWLADDLGDIFEFCSFHENTVGSGIGWRSIVNTFCVGVLRDGRHVHVDVQYGYNGDKAYFHAKKVVLEEGE